MVIAGHTHRPVFRPLSKLSLLRGVHEWLLGYQEHTTDANMCRLLPPVIEQIQQVIQIFDDEKPSEQSLDNVPYYMNEGSCVHTNGITALEIDRGEIRLIRWDKPKEVAEKSPIPYHLNRKVYQSGDLGEILSKINIMASLPVTRHNYDNMPPSLQEIGALTGLANLMLP